MRLRKTNFQWAENTTTTDGFDVHFRRKCCILHNLAIKIHETSAENGSKRKTNFFIFHSKCQNHTYARRKSSFLGRNIGKMRLWWYFWCLLFEKNTHKQLWGQKLMKKWKCKFSSYYTHQKSFIFAQFCIFSAPVREITMQPS